MASGNMKAVKRRIKSVGNTMQITKAMELVASSKLRRAKQNAEQARPFFEAEYKMLMEIAEGADLEPTSFAVKRPVRNRLFIVIAGDRGLAGGYNSNIFKLVANVEAGRNRDGAPADTGQGLLKVESPGKPKIIAIGRRAVDYFSKHGYDVVGRYGGFAETAKTVHCAGIAEIVSKMFLAQEVDEVRVFYTRYVSSMTQEATSSKILPLAGTKKRTEFVTPTRYDPSPDAVFQSLVPGFIMSLLKCAVEDSYASEQCARRIAMESATDNAEQMIEHLSLLYNRARQEKITNEINEIVSGANAQI
ncbi:ATP synthase gamma chain [Clostridia bacterium]|nr:ATP synthase gamma chain [Clostridia bacterium]